MAAQAGLLERSDSLFEERKLTESFDLLAPYADGSSDDPELLWRVVRMYFRKYKEAQSRDKKEAEQLAKKGFEISKKAMGLGSGIAKCNLMAGLMLRYYSDTLGMKEKMSNLKQVKGHFEKAVELDLNDMAARHVLGTLHFNVASIPSGVGFLFSNVPSSTYQEALSHFEAAEKLNYEGFIQNWLLLGKTHLKLKNKPEAKKWLTKVTESGDSSQHMVHESLGATAQGSVFGVSLGMVQLDNLMCTGKEDPLLREAADAKEEAEKLLKKL